MNVRTTAVHPFPFLSHFTAPSEVQTKQDKLFPTLLLIMTHLSTATLEWTETKRVSHA